MELSDAPNGPYSDESIGTCSIISHPFGHEYNDSSMDEILEHIVGVLVSPLPVLPDFVSLGFFGPFRAELKELHCEVQFCLWAMNTSLSVYMKLLSLVDISTRMEISNKVSQFLANWKGGKTAALSDTLDAFIISEFVKHSVTEIPDMERLQRDKDCHVLSSTVACYVKDIALNLNSVSQNDLESTIEIIFPPSKNFIGRCFFPRLAVVSSRLLELINSRLSLELSDDSTKSTVSSTQKLE